MRKLIRSALFCSLLIAKYTQTTSALAPISSSYDEETGEHVVTFENNRLLNELSICNQFLKNRHANAEGDPLQDWDCCDNSMVAQSFSYQATSNSLKSYNRASLHAGPGQVLDLAQRDSCLSVGDVLEFEVFFMLLAHDDQPYMCNTDRWNQPLTCPIMSLGVTKPDGSFVFVNSYNEIGRSDWVPDEWNRFFTTATVDEMLMQASKIDIRLRGIPKSNKFVISDPSLRAVRPPVPCDQMLINGDGKAEDPLDGWNCCWNQMISIPQAKFRADGSFGYKSYQHASNSAGPGQYLDLLHRDSCLEVGTKIIFEAHIMTLDSFDQPYVCSSDTWGTANTCPIMSFHVTKPSGSKVFKNGSKSPRADWVDNNWNLFKSSFVVDTAYMAATGINIRLRGIPKANRYLISDARLYVDNPPTQAPTTQAPTITETSIPTSGPTNLPTMAPTHTPTVPPTISSKPTYFTPTVSPTANPTMAVTTQHPTFSRSPTNYPSKSAYIAPRAEGCDMLVNNGDFEMGSVDPYPWSVNQGGILSLVSPGAGGSNYSLKVGGRETEHYGPKHPLSIACFNKDAQFEVKANIKLVATTATSRKLQSDSRFDQPGCTELLVNGLANAADPKEGWNCCENNLSVLSPGFSAESNAIKSTNRWTVNSGPGQTFDLFSRDACLQLEDKLNFVAYLKTLDANDQPYKCSTDEFNKPLACPFLSFRITKSDGTKVWKNGYMKGSKDDWVAGEWNHFYTTINVDQDFLDATEISLRVRGIPAENSILISDASLTGGLEAYVPPTPNPTDQPSCTELLVNGLANADDPKEGWNCCENNLSVLSPGFSAESNAIKSTNRWTVNSGPGQTFSLFSRDACLQLEDKLNFVAYLKTLDANDQPYKCSTDEFNKPLTCPFLSFRITKSDGTKVWKNGYMKGSKDDWVAGEWNHFYTTINVDQDFLDATEISLRVRGIPAENSILISDASLASELEAYVPPTSNPTMSATIALDESFFRSSSINETTFNETSLNETEIVDETTFNETSLNETEIVDETTFNETSLNETEIVEGIEGEITENGTAPALLSGGNVTESPGSCDPLSPTSMCPILTIHVIYETGEEHKYSPNIALVKWESEQYNEFHAFFEITEMMTNAIEAYFYFEGPPGGIDMYIDDVVVREFQPLPLDNIHVEGDDWMTSSCDEIVRNGDAETGDTAGWTARLGGRLSIRPEGADGTSFSFEHNARTSFIMGPKHVLKTNCFTPGMQYVLNAKMKLLDENGDHFACDKNHTWIDDVSCPILTFELTSMSGAKSWKYFGNMDMEPWEALFWNDFTVPFIVNEEIMNAVEAFFFIERPRAGITIILDQVTIDRDCTKLIAESNAEDHSLLGWEVMYGSGGYTAIHPEGHAGSMNSYGFFGRTANVGGPGHPIDKACLSVGNLYEFKAWIKLFDELNGDQPVDCRKYSTTDSSSTCPALSLVINKNDSTKTLTWQNRDKTTWVPEEFNYFTAVFEVTQEMLDFGNLNLIIKGTRIGVAVLFDDVKIDLYEPPESNCDHLVEDGHFESGNLLNWGFRQSGSMHFYEGGYNNSTQSLICVNREMVGAGCSYKLDNSCLVEGKEYMFSAQLKLETENGDPFYCNKDKDSGDEACPMLGFEVTANGTTTVMNKANHHPGNWKADGWNYFHTKLTVDHRMAQGDKVTFYFRGPQVGMGVIMDDVHMDIYEPPAQDCFQLITNTNAENDSLMGWQSNDGGFITIRDGGSMGSAHSFVHSHRTGHWMGPRQDIDVGCLVEGKIYEFNAHIKLELEDGTPFACDKSAAWKTELTCPLVTIKCNIGTTIKSYYANNLFGVDWLENEFNIYRGEMEVKPEMATAESCYWYIQGPSAGKNIVFDNINLRYVSGP